MSYRFFENKSCEFYPCHKMEKINCLFCFCPLFQMENCGGNYIWIKKSNGLKEKDCSNCQLPHSLDGYDYIIKKLVK